MTATRQSVSFQSDSHEGTFHEGTSRSRWQVSWPLLIGAYVFLMVLYNGHFVGLMLADGDTYWHIAAGRWIVDHLSIPVQDPFSGSMRGEPWTAKEWISQVVLSRAHDLGGWGAVVAVVGLAFSSAFIVLCRALLRNLQPMRALLFTAMAVLMATSHLLARPFILAMPVMMIWMVELFAAADERRAPRLWLLPVMTLWANMHGGFTLGIAMAMALACEVLLSAWRTAHFRELAGSWGLFLLLTLISALLTPQGIQGFWFTWQVMAEDTYALSRISEWASPNFHDYQPLQLWLLGGMALVLHQGLRLPAVRLAILLGLLHLSLKHVRNVELLGLIGPLIVAKPFAQQWQAASRSPSPVRRDDLFLQRLAAPAGAAISIVLPVVLASAAVLLNYARPVTLPEITVPSRALDAVRAAHVNGPVLNDYGWGGALIYAGISPYIDSRQDLYRDKFMRRFLEALELKNSNGLQDLLETSQIEWTLLRPGTPAVALLDVLPGWKRLYTDTQAVVHVRDRTRDRGTSEPQSQP